MWAPVTAVRSGSRVVRTTVLDMMRLMVRICVPAPVRAAAGAVWRPVSAWCWATRPRRVAVRVVAWWHLLGLMSITGPVAFADASSGVPGNVALSWMDVTDSSGISVWRYYLSIDRGGVNAPIDSMSAWLISIEYEIYRALAGISIWFIGWALKFEWLDIFLGPVETLSDSVSSILGQLGLVPTLMVIAALTAGVWIIRGQWSSGIFEFVITATIAAAAVTVLSNPLASITGEDGVLTQSRTMGLELGSALGSEGRFEKQTPDQMVDEIKAGMADTLIRQPTQLLNFGRVIDTDSRQCLDAWNAGHEDVPGNNVDTLKDNIAGCGGDGAEQMKDFADHPGPGQVFAGALLIVAGGVIWIFSFLLAGATVLAGMWALYSAVSLLVTLVAGLISSARGALLKDLSMVFIACLMVVATILFVVAYLLIVRAFFQDEGGGGLMERVFYVDVVLVVGLLMFRKLQKRWTSAADALSAKLGRRPGGAKPTSITKPTRPELGRTLRSGRQAMRTASTAASNAVTGTKKAAKIAGVTGKMAGASTGGTALAVTAVTVAAGRGVKSLAGVVDRKVKSLGDVPGSGGDDAGGDVSDTSGRKLVPASTAPSDLDSDAGEAAPSPAVESISPGVVARERRPGASPDGGTAPTGMLREVTRERGVHRPAHSAPLASASTGSTDAASVRVSSSGTARSQGRTFRELATEGGRSLYLPTRGADTRRDRERDSHFGGSSARTVQPEVLSVAGRR